MAQISRRDFLKNAAALAGVVAVGGMAAACAPVAPPPAAAPTAAPTAAPPPTAAPAAKKVWLGNSIRSLSNPYHASWNNAGQAFAKEMGLSDSYQVLLSEGDNTKQLDDIKSLLAKAGKDAVFNVDPNEASNAVPIAKMLEEAGVYFMTHWNKPDDAHPWDYKYWVAHTAADDVTASYETAKAMFEKIGGKGNAVHIQGMLGNTAAQNRQKGFEKAVAEYPNIKVLEINGGTWDQVDAQKLVENWLAKYDTIDVIHTAGDPSAMGAVAAIKAVKPEMLGKILISGFNGDEPTTKAILAGEVFATAGVPAAWQGAFGLNLPYQAYLGKFDPTKEPKEHREFFFKTTTVTKENAQDWLDNNINGTPDFNYDDLWSGVSGPMTY